MEGAYGDSRHEPEAGIAAAGRERKGDGKNIKEEDNSWRQQQ